MKLATAIKILQRWKLPKLGAINPTPKDPRIFSMSSKYIDKNGKEIVKL